MKNSKIKLFVNYVSGNTCLFIDGEFVCCRRIDEIDDIREDFYLYNFYDDDGMFMGYDMILKFDVDDVDMRY